MTKHISFFLVLTLLIIAFGCGKSKEPPPAGQEQAKTEETGGDGQPPAEDQNPPDESSGLSDAFAPFKSEGLDEATGLWKEIVHKKSGIRLRLIPAGEFDMGSTETHETPVHHVKISKPFYLGKYEVTQIQWKTMMGDNPSNFKGDSLPVEKVTWQDARDFCGRTGLRLPTEAEWEYACRAGNAAPWCFGDAESGLVDYAWYVKNANEKTHSSGQKRPNAWGLYDMHGNVSEWCEDLWHDTYDGAPTDGAAWTADGMQNYRVDRGSSWNYSARLARSAHRTKSNITKSDSNTGFRVAMTP